MHTIWFPMPSKTLSWMPITSTRCRDREAYRPPLGTVPDRMLSDVSHLPDECDSFPRPTEVAEVGTVSLSFWRDAQRAQTNGSSRCLPGHAQAGLPSKYSTGWACQERTGMTKTTSRAGCVPLSPTFSMARKRDAAFDRPKPPRRLFLKLPWTRN